MYDKISLISVKNELVFIRRLLVLIISLMVLAPGLSQAWWHDDWAYRKEITLDTTAAGANIAGSIDNIPVLVRLHTGNFKYFLDMQPDGSDIRFIASDDITPLKYSIEFFDPVNEMAMIWVQVPLLAGNANTDKIWMYYGSGNAVSGEDSTGTYDVNQTAVLNFGSRAGAKKDVSAYHNNPPVFTAELMSGTLIGEGVHLDGSQFIQLPDALTLRTLPESGWTFSTWLKMVDNQTDSVLIQRGDEDNQLMVGIDGQSAYIRLQGPDEQAVESARNTLLTPGGWHHLALVVNSGRVSLYLDGVETSYIETGMPELAGSIFVGADPDAKQGFSGELDEVEISNVARSADWLQAAVAIQGPQSGLLIYGEDGQQESKGADHSYFAVILKSVTLDGWVVIAILAVMLAISWVVMISKGVVLSRVGADNASFLSQFEQLGRGHEQALDAEESEEDDEARESPFMLALSSKHEHFQSSSLYRLYHGGVQEMRKREIRTVGSAASYSFSPQAIDAIKATMDAGLVRENQKLNSQMVLLTIAISGGPFLGLLGTVVGVMITFAAIAASGDVNVNAIAPGIAAALVATVAGLAVAIPALFGYNWLGSKIKEMSAEMQVFVDEFITKIAEQHGESS